MDAQMYKFPTGEKQSKPLPPWVPPVSAGVWFIGVRQTLVPDRENVFAQQPYFLVGIYNGVMGDQKADFTIEVEGTNGLHAMLNLLVDAARARDQGFTVIDYSNGETGMAEEYRSFADQE
jgi:hypothetical protein